MSAVAQQQTREHAPYQDKVTLHHSSPRVSAAPGFAHQPRHCALWAVHQGTDERSAIKGTLFPKKGDWAWDMPPPEAGIAAMRCPDAVEAQALGQAIASAGLSGAR
jgi:hypothetical protein